MNTRKHLLFVSTRFLFPADSGGKIRTSQILRGMKGRRFAITLVSPATRESVSAYKKNLGEICDEFFWWPQSTRGTFQHYARLRHITSDLPIPVRTDNQPEGKKLVARLLQRDSFVVAFDFVHAAILAPRKLSCPSVMFTHNVEADIFRRHVQVAKNNLMKFLWTNQYVKMRSFEARVLPKFDVVVAVSDRDANVFERDYGFTEPFVIPTGVDLEFFTYAPPTRCRDVVFCGSMDWLANQEAVEYFMDHIWNKIVARLPDARMTVVGRSPPSRLISNAARRELNWSFTGRVDDVRQFVHGAVSVLPLRVGGGTRLKVYEAMAMGSPLVSTTIGVEGLPIREGEHYVRADAPEEIANSVVQLLKNDTHRHCVAARARRYVEENCSYQVAAEAFEEACERAIDIWGTTHPTAGCTSGSKKTPFTHFT